MTILVFNNVWYLLGKNKSPKWNHCLSRKVIKSWIMFIFALNNSETRWNILHIICEVERERRSCRYPSTNNQVCHIGLKVLQNLPAYAYVRWKVTCVVCRNRVKFVSEHQKVEELYAWETFAAIYRSLWSDWIMMLSSGSDELNIMAPSASLIIMLYSSLMIRN